MQDLAVQSTSPDNLKTGGRVQDTLRRMKSSNFIAMQGFKVMQSDLAI